MDRFGDAAGLPHAIGKADGLAFRNLQAQFLAASVMAMVLALVSTAASTVMARIAASLIRPSLALAASITFFRVISVFTVPVV